MHEGKVTGEFVFEQSDAAPLESALYQQHLKLTDKSHMTAFAGYLMPLWYSSVTAEHRAVRWAAGLFDCTHMGVLEIAGAQASAFLNSVTTNEIDNLKPGGAQYSYVLDAAGNVLDDIIVYRRKEDNFMMVVNAANEPKIKSYLEGLINDRVVIDAGSPGRKLPYKPAIRNMKDTNTGSDCKIDIALQGPQSANILCSLTEDRQLKDEIENIKPFNFIETALAGTECIMSRTGYTGAKIGFELFVHPQKAPQLWDTLLQNGGPFGLMPCGLGARDSLRIEAGLPLYGHELAGPFNILPFEAGYGWAVKLRKKFFIGKTPAQTKAKDYDMKVARVELPGRKGIRPVRQNDGVLNNANKCIGWVLSCAKVDEKQFALVYVTGETVKQADPVGIYYLARSRSQQRDGRKQSVQKDETLRADLVGTAVSRFAKF